jgi:hypothetical protein
LTALCRDLRALGIDGAGSATGQGTTTGVRVCPARHGLLGGVCQCAPDAHAVRIGSAAMSASGRDRKTDFTK